MTEVLDSRWTRSHTLRLRCLASVGYTPQEIADELKFAVDIIFAKAHMLGYSLVPRPAPKKRPCMRCKAIFKSTGPAHRMCDNCHEYAARVSPLAL